MKPIETGDMIPEFSLPDQDGKIFDVKNVLGQKKLVIFFYPRDGSHGCTREACYFRDFSEIFIEADAVIIGISGQSVESHKDFAAKYSLNYPLLSDKGDKVRELFGVPSDAFGMIPGRVTYVVSKEGKVVHVFNSQTQVRRHVDEALKVVLVLRKADAGDS
ncbi:MAG: peroxiredoxin [Bacteroidales bacterium]|nr:peroxiredoxin [Bacteroidales bacterium]